MNFATYLTESAYKKTYTKDEIVKLIKENCDTSKLIYRGMSDGDDFYKITGENGGRKSANTSNHYTIILDHFIAQKNSKYPLRSKSIICTDDYDFAENFNETVYVILPFKDTILGRVNDIDMWSKKINIGPIKIDIEYLNDMYHSLDITSSSYEAFIKDLETLLDADKVKDKNYHEDDLSYSDALEYIYLAFDFDSKNVRPYIEKAYGLDTLKFTFVTPKTNPHNAPATEYWIGGPCAAVKYSEWKSIKEQL